MNSRIVEEASSDINWNEEQLFKSLDTGVILLTYGKHTEKLFEGTVILATTDSVYKVGSFRSTWVKEVFTEIKLPITIKFNN